MTLVPLDPGVAEVGEDTVGAKFIRHVRHQEFDRFAHQRQALRAIGHRADLAVERIVALVVEPGMVLLTFGFRIAQGQDAGPIGTGGAQAQAPHHELAGA